MALKLQCIKGAEAGQVLVIPDEGSLVIGRSKSADISVDDKLLSRKHICVSVQGNVALLEDLRSSNGTYLNGERVTDKVRVVASDRIKIGNHVFQVELTEGMIGYAPTNEAGSDPLPISARPIEFCPVTFRANAREAMVDRPGVGLISPDCAGVAEYPEDMIEGFKLVERLGEGRLGVVYKARHLALNKFVAIKIIRPEQARSELTLRRWVREAKIGGRLFHPHILEMYDAAVSNRHYYISMEYVEGETLGQRIGMYGALPVVEAVSYGAKIAEALAYAHGQGVVHRYVTPACVFLGALGQVKLGDFGLAKLTSPGEPNLTPKGEPVGSLLYMAPEQLEDASSVDHRADVYGLGASLYHVLLGYPPFAADGVAGVLENRRRGALLPLLEARPDCPEGLATIITHCLAKDRAHRYQTAAELTQALAAL